MNQMKNWIEAVGKVLQKWFSTERKVTKTAETGVHKKQNPQSPGKSALSKTTETMLAMETFLDGKYDFRYNRLTEETEYRRRDVSRGKFNPLDQRALNSFCIEARKEGIDCWDRDISRYVYSKNVVEYHPFQLFLNELPEWDGVERVEALAARVSASPLWVKSFRRWMLGMVAQWLQMDQLHANSVAPLLVSRRQGRQKSTFCKLLLPEVLQHYYTDSFDVSMQSGAERKLSLGWNANIPNTGTFIRWCHCNLLIDS